MLAYKELSRVHTANGWNWLDEWARDGRFRPEYLPGSVVSGRWATRGGGALQIPRALRRAVVADPGYRLVVADAAQLEPRVLAAVSGDACAAAVSADADLYTALATDGFGGDRAQAKVAMLGAMYGATSGGGGPAAADAAPPLPGGDGVCGDGRPAGGGRRRWCIRCWAGPARRRADLARRRRGRDRTGRDRCGTPARRPVRQGPRPLHPQLRRAGLGRGLGLGVAVRSAAGTWPVVPGAELVFFQHDELIVHVPTESADAVSRADHRGGGIGAPAGVSGARR